MKGNGTTDRIVRALAAGLLLFLAAASPAVPLSAVRAASEPKPAAEPPPFAGTARPFVFLKRPRAVALGPFEDGQGRTVTIERYRGRVLLLNFWATWCAPCIHEMPTLDRLQGALGGPEFAVLTVALDRRGMATVGPFWQAQGYRNLPVLLDTRWKTARRLGVSGLPATFLIDPEGRVIGYLLGPAEWDSPQARAFLRFYIARAGG